MQPAQGELYFIPISNQEYNGADFEVKRTWEIRKSLTEK
jgi:hypothetical protein